MERWVCFNDPAWESLWVGGVGGMADTSYLYPARWGWIKKIYPPTKFVSLKKLLSNLIKIDKLDLNWCYIFVTTLKNFPSNKWYANIFCIVK